MVGLKSTLTIVFITVRIVGRIKHGFRLLLSVFFGEDGVHFHATEVIPGSEEDVQFEIYDD